MLSHSKVYALYSKLINRKQYLYAHVVNEDYVDIDKHGLYYSTDFRKTWKKAIIYQRPPWMIIPSILGNPLNNEVWFITRQESRIFYTLNGYSEWNEIPKMNFKYLNDKISDFAFDPIDKNLKYICAGVNEYKLYRHDQKTGYNIDLNVNANSVIVAQDDNKKIITNTGKLSLDGGWTWQDILPNIQKINPDFRFIRQSSSRPIYFESSKIIFFLYVSDWFGSSINYHYLISTENLGQTWKILKAFKKSRVESILIDDNDPNIMGAILYDSKQSISTVGISLDGGVIWRNIFWDKNDDYRESDIYSITFSNLEMPNKLIYIGGKMGLIKNRKSINALLERRVIKFSEDWIKLGGIIDQKEK